MVMDPNILRDRNAVIDLESGITANERSGPDSRHAKPLLSKVSSSFVKTERSIEGLAYLSYGYATCVDVPRKSGESPAEKKIDRQLNVGPAEKKMETETLRKKKPCKKAPKPPRPPRAPSLDSADQRLIHEMSELVVLRRARMERLKSMKKMKTANGTSSNSSLCALVITVLFCLVIIWQGFGSRRHSNVIFEGPPDSTVGNKRGLILVQHGTNVSPSNSDGLASTSPGTVEWASGIDSQGEASRIAGYVRVGEGE